MILENQFKSNLDINKNYNHFINTIKQKKTTEKKKIENKIKKENEINTFQSLIEEVLPEKKEPELHQLWLQLPEVERKLIQSPTEETLEQYKNMVQKIAKLLLEKNLKLETIKRKSSTGKEILLSYVKVIDIKLHKMMLALQSKQNTAFEILRNLKEIRGLLLDLKH